MRTTKRRKHAPGWLLIVAMLLMLAPTPSAAATPTPANLDVHGGPLGVALPKDKANRSTSASNLTYHNGPVMRANTVHAIYWQPAGAYMSPNYQSLINGFFANVATAITNQSTSNVYHSDRQYYDTTGSIGNEASFAGGIVDTNPFPANGCTDAYTSVCLSDAQIRAEIDRVVGAGPRGTSTVYFMFTPKGVGSCFDASYCTFSNVCAYHSWYGTGSGLTLYANMSYDDTVPEQCDSGQHPNGDDADATINTISHEHNETITDEQGSGWYDGSLAGEDGDKCNFNFGSAIGSTAYGQYNQLINGGTYYLQQEWSNAAGGCVLTDNIGPPLTPTNLHKTSATNSSVGFAWNNADAQSYIAASNGVTAFALGQNTASYTATGVSPGYWTCLSVAAYNAVGASAWSPWACGFALPSAPSGIYVASTTGSSVTFGWTAPDPYSGIAVSDGNSVTAAVGNTFTSTHLFWGNWACISLAAYNASGASPWTGWACGQATGSGKPSTPTDLHITSVTSSTFYYALTNTPGTQGVYVTNGDSYYDLGAASPGPYYIYWPGWPPNHYMCFAVSDYNSAGYSPWTPWVCGYTLASGPDQKPPADAKRVPDGPSTVPKGPQGTPPAAPKPTPAPGASKPTDKPSGKP